MDYSKPRPLKVGELRLAKKKRNMSPSETSNVIGEIWGLLMRFGGRGPSFNPPSLKN
jgi:hypothetical protein